MEREVVRYGPTAFFFSLGIPCIAMHRGNFCTAVQGKIVSRQWRAARICVHNLIVKMDEKEN